MKATIEILKGIFLEGHTIDKSIILLPLSIIEIIFYGFYFILGKINMQFLVLYILQIIIMISMALNIWAIIFQTKHKKSSMFILLFATYPIFAKFPEIQQQVSWLKVILLIAWVSEIINEYMFSNMSDNFFSRNMIVMYTIICIMLELGMNYILLVILLLLMTVNFINVSKIK